MRYEVAGGADNGRESLAGGTYVKVKFESGYLGRA
jgi:hypothetical protein